VIPVVSDINLSTTSCLTAHDLAFKPLFANKLLRLKLMERSLCYSASKFYALKTVEENAFRLYLRIDSPGGTVGDSQEICSALKRLRSKVKIVASFGNISFPVSTSAWELNTSWRTPHDHRHRILSEVITWNAMQISVQGNQVWPL